MSDEDDPTYFVYVFAKCLDDGWGAPVKVGISKDVDRRLSMVQTSCPFKIVDAWWFQYPNKEIAQTIERMFHYTQKEHRLYGEWFNIEPVKAIHLLCIGTRAALEVHLTDKSIIPAALDCAGIIWAEKKFNLAVPSMP